MGVLRKVTWYLAWMLLFLTTSTTGGDDVNDAVNQDVQSWALRFGNELAGESSYASQYHEVSKSYMDHKAEPEYMELHTTFEGMVRELDNLINKKVNSLEVLVRAAEDAAKDLKFDPNINFRYKNAKKIYNAKKGEVGQDEDWTDLETFRSKDFDSQLISINDSTIHVATNIFHKAPPVLNAVKWSEKLNSNYRNNRVRDPFLSWQFFCSSTGFLRVFPGIQWRPKHYHEDKGDDEDDPPDMYECRTRTWYVEAAASPKDVLILLDGSGSMTGLRKEIAKNVVTNILDTLSDNDYVNVLRFSDVIEPVVEIFNKSLVQATARNIREFKGNLEQLETVNIANFTEALTEAFKILQYTNRSLLGSQCNQAIMLITDGAPHTYEEIFEQYNWPNIPVRVFTYLIGREVTDTMEVNWMACANRGYYTHVTTLAEVREQVQKYVPVMSRPLILSREHPIIWTAAYGDFMEQKLTDWLWEEKEQRKLRKLYIQKMYQPKMAALEYDGPLPLYSIGANSPNVTSKPEPEALKAKGPKQKVVTLYTTVASPVFNLSNETDGTANLLGVMGIDVPIKEFQKEVPAWKLGVNAYSFMINRNGHLLYHPDLRPMFQDMLKPYYSNIDMVEVEQVNQSYQGPCPRENFDQRFLQMRMDMIHGKRGWVEEVVMKKPVDGLKRVVTRPYTYQYGALNNTFSLALAFPLPYGGYQIKGKLEVYNCNNTSEDHCSKYFEGNNWKLHPDWEYCFNKDEENIGNEPTQEELFRSFLRAIRTGEVRWKSSGITKLYKSLTCDQDLVSNLLFDAKVTHHEELRIRSKNNHGRDEELPNRGIVTTFIATRTGLTRFRDHRTEEEKKLNPENALFQINTRAIDELFYRRAVYFHSANKSAFVYSVPFDAGSKYDCNDSDANLCYVTGSRPVFIGDDFDKSAPAAVVGLQIKYSVLREKFFNITSRCTHQKPCNYTCDNGTLDCFLLDNNGFVVLSSRSSEVGKFFGEIDSTLFDSMAQYDIYRKITIYDYQAICIDQMQQSGPANFITSPFHILWKGLGFIWQKLVMILVHYNLLSFWNMEWAVASDYSPPDDYMNDDPLIPSMPKRKARPCDMQKDLYEMSPRDLHPVKGKLVLGKQIEGERSCDKHFIVQPIQQSNLIMLIVYKDCNTTSQSSPLQATEIIDQLTNCNNTELPRKRPDRCMNYHKGEMDLKKQCGLAAISSASNSLLFGLLFLVQLIRWV